MKSFARIFLKRFRQTHDRDSPGWGCATALLDADDVTTSPETKNKFLQILGQPNTKVGTALEEFQLQLKSSYWSKLDFKQPLKLKFKRKGHRLSLRVSPREPTPSASECAADDITRGDPGGGPSGEGVVVGDREEPSPAISHNMTSCGDCAGVQEAVLFASTTGEAGPAEHESLKTSLL
ncbi:hypothetical protein BaRGS_00039237 [Batillaria attramentaria]|uniref:Uncharacterized protein n=1 Tax=Batillaria attramentaria TaxID=370345 RepID=A0ABD0J3U2_9CAEN